MDYLDADFTYLSLGAGVQSTALLICSAKGIYNVPKADVAIFSDTGEEPRWTYEALSMLERWSSIPIVRVSAGNRLTEPKQGVYLPAFVRRPDGAPGMLSRYCTREYKIDPINQWLRKRLGYEPRKRVRHTVLGLVGISWDERQRAKNSRLSWVTLDFPLIDEGITRDHCRGIIKSEGLPVPGKSSCVVCPYHTDDYWLTLRKMEPENWEYACDYDRRIRNASSVDGEVYLHRSLVPLSEARFKNINENQLDLWEGASDEACEGFCGL